MAPKQIVARSGRVSHGLVWKTTHLLLFFFGFAAASTAQTAGNLDATFDPRGGPNASIRAITTQADGRILVGGAFTDWDGSPQIGLVRLNADGSRDQSFACRFAPAQGVQVDALAVTSAGTIYVGGTFSSVDGRVRAGLARLHPDGALDAAFDPALPPNSAILALAVDSHDRVIAAGEFVLPGPVARTAVARFLASGSVDPSFGPLLAPLVPPAGVVVGFSQPRFTALALLADGGLATGGDFSGITINGQSYSGNPLRFDSSGAYERAKSPTSNDSVHCVLGLPDGAIIVGYSLNAGRNDADPVRRFLPNSARDLTFSPVFRGQGTAAAQVRSFLLEADGRIVVGGDFESVNGIVRHRLARLLSDGGLDNRFAATAAPDGSVLALAQDGSGRILLGGDFSRVHGVTRSRIARLDNPPLPPGLRTPPAGVTIAAGSNVRLRVTVDPEPGLVFQWSSNGTPIPGATTSEIHLVDVQSDASYTVAVANRVATVSPPAAALKVVPRVAGVLDHSFAPEVSGALIPRPDGRLYLANRTTLHLLNPDGSVDPSFRLETNSSTILGGAVLPDGRVLLRVRSGSDSTLERYFPDGRRDSSFALRGLPSVTVNSYVVRPDGSLVLGGRFDPSSTTNPMRVLVRTDPDGRYDETFRAPSFAWPSEITQLHPLPDGSLVAAGEFRSAPLEFVGTTLRFLADGVRDPNWRPGPGTQDQLMSDGRIFRLDSETGRLRRINPDGSVAPGFDCLVQRVEDRGPGRVFLLPGSALLRAQSDGKILLQGGFGRVNGIPASALARINADGSLDATFTRPTFNPGGDASLFELDGQLYAQGEFQQINGVHRPGLARLFRDGVGASRIVNLSAKARAASNENALFAGFVLAGSENSQVLVRGVGPALAGFGIGDALSAPELTLFQGDRIIGLNSSWPSGGPDIATVMDRVGAFRLAPASADSALIAELAPGAYTARVAPSAGLAGVALIEVYADAPAGAAGRLVNLAARGELGSDAAGLVVGFSLAGTGEKQVLLRVVGPTLGAFGVAGALPNPRLKLMGPTGRLAENDDWTNDSGSGFAAEAARKVGAFALPPGKDACLLRTLLPGSYTLVAESADAAEGVVLVEIFEISR